MIKIQPYNASFNNKWDELINKSRNGTFLFFRDYMEYHSDRFNDASLLIFRKEKLVGVLPGNTDGTVFYSHQGLTYGGLISSADLGIKDVIEIFKGINSFLKPVGIKEVIYKPVPLIYHRIPTQEDIYALYLLGAKKIGCNISSTIYQNCKIPFTESRKSGLRKSGNNNVQLYESNNFNLFWEILNENLKNKYETKAVHSLNEILYLKSKFPQNIKLFVAEYQGSIVAGTVIYQMPHIAHVQYISSSQRGKETGALDMLFDSLINEVYKDTPVFDFGQSTEQMGAYLNENLIFQKEGFGGRGVVYDIYKYNIQ